MSSVVYQKLEKPAQLLFVAPLLLTLEIASSMAVLIVSQEPLAAIILIVPAHLFCYQLTNNEPHINNILRNYFIRALGINSSRQPKDKTPFIF